MKIIETDILIVGAGPAGMVLSCLLGREGIKTLVIEKGESFEREFRGEVLQPRFHKALKDVGLFEHVKQAPHGELSSGHIFYNGREVANFDFLKVDKENGSPWWMTQPILLESLKTYANKYPDFKLQFSTELTTIEKNLATVKQGEETYQIKSKLIVGADGRFSRVKQSAHFEILYENHDVDILWFLVERPDNYDNFFGAFLSLKHNFLILPKYPNLLQCGMILRAKELPKIRKAGIEAIKPEIKEAHPFFENFADNLKDFKEFTYLKGSISYTKEWAKDGILLIGDAAHTCSPVGGIGVSIAVETACVASKIIKGCLADNDFSKEKLLKLQRLREREVKEVHNIQMRTAFVAVRSPKFLRVFIPYLLKFVSGLGVFPIILRRLITQKKRLPLD